MEWIVWLILAFVAFRVIVELGARGAFSRSKVISVSKDVDVILAELQDNRDKLSPWERGFVSDMASREDSFWESKASDKQLNKLAEIHGEKVMGAEKGTVGNASLTDHED